MAESTEERKGGARGGGEEQGEEGRSKEGRGEAEILICLLTSGSRTS